MTRRAPLVASSLPPRVAVVAALILAGSACEDTETSARPEGWSTETHSKDVDPDYTTVFDTSVVHRIDIEIGSRIGNHARPAVQSRCRVPDLESDGVRSGREVCLKIGDGYSAENTVQAADPGIAVWRNSTRGRHGVEIGQIGAGRNPGIADPGCERSRYRDGTGR